MIYILGTILYFLIGGVFTGIWSKVMKESVEENAILLIMWPALALLLVIICPFYLAYLLAKKIAGQK